TAASPGRSVDRRGAGVVGRLGEDRRSCTAERPGGWGAGAWNRRVGPARGTGAWDRRAGPACGTGSGGGRRIWGIAPPVPVCAGPGTRDAAALDGGRVVGYAIASRDGRTAHVHRIAVRREARGQGIARGLVEWIEAEARIMGLGELRTSVADANHRALAFWRRLGFRPVEGAALEAYAARRGLPVSGSCYLAGGNRYRVLRRAVRDRA